MAVLIKQSIAEYRVLLQSALNQQRDPAWDDRHAARCRIRGLPAAAAAGPPRAARWRAPLAGRSARSRAGSRTAGCSRRGPGSPAPSRRPAATTAARTGPAAGRLPVHAGRAVEQGVHRRPVPVPPPAARGTDAPHRHRRPGAGPAERLSLDVSLSGVGWSACDARKCLSVAGFLACQRSRTEHTERHSAGEG